MSKQFEKVKAGLEANIAMRAEAAKDEKQRWKTVLSQVPAERHKMAQKLLSDPRVRMSDVEIVKTCNIGMAAPEGDTSTGKQALFAAGMTEAARLLDKPAPSVPEAYPDAPREFHIDPARFAAGEAMARELKSFMASAR